MRTIIFIFATILSFSIWAENDKGNAVTTTENKVSGKIVDHFTGENLAGVKIMVINSGATAYTDLDGNFSIDLPAGTNASNIQISYISYETMTISIDEIKRPGEIKILPVARN